MTEEEILERHWDLIEEKLDNILGESHEYMSASEVPFYAGGLVDVYYYPNAINGTGLATQELIQPDGSGPMPNTFGTYEVLAFTKKDVDEEGFEEIKNEMCVIFTSIGMTSKNKVLNPKETIEFTVADGDNVCVFLDEWDERNTRFEIDDHKHGLLLVIRVFVSELQYAKENGTGNLINLLKENGHYPYSDLDRDPVV